MKSCLEKKEVVATKVGIRQKKSSPAAAFSSSYTKSHKKKIKQTKFFGKL